MSNPRDTIVAQATPMGRGGVGIIRLSGTNTSVVATSILGKLPKPRYAEFSRFVDKKGCAIDQGIALYFPAPHSLTGEDVLELHAHGGPVVLSLLLQEILNCGARLARPGEFLERAFLNNKIDLLQAEATADLIEASSEYAARSALRSLQGEFSRRIHVIVDTLIELRTYIEAAIDFPEEEIDFLSDQKVSESLSSILDKLREVQLAAKQGALLRDGVQVVIAGKPNAGKSSLLNQLSGREAAIVTDIPGTTRDILREKILIDGLPLHVIDTAGLRKAKNKVEEEGIRRAKEAIAQADCVLLVVDITKREKLALQEFPTGKTTVIYNKIDLQEKTIPIANETNGMKEIYLSAKTGIGMDLLVAHLKSWVGFKSQEEGDFIARQRHLEALARAHQLIEAGQKQLRENQAGELLAEDLRQAQQVLGEITGEFHSDDLLGRIFSSFCVGK